MRVIGKAGKGRICKICNKIQLLSLRVVSCGDSWSRDSFLPQHGSFHDSKLLDEGVDIASPEMS